MLKWEVKSLPACGKISTWAGGSRREITQKETERVMADIRNRSEITKDIDHGNSKYNKANAYRKEFSLSPEDREKIIELRKQGVLAIDIAKMYSVSPAMISRIWVHQGWGTERCRE